MINVIWDFDGTIVDSYPYIVKAFHEIANANNLDFSEKKILKMLKTNTSKELLLELSEKMDIEPEKVQELFSSKFIEYESKIGLIDEVEETLKQLNQKNVRNYIYTHKGKTTYDVLKNNDIHHYFLEVVTSEFGFERKPHPEALEYLINEHHLDREKTYYVGDRSLDIDCANNAKVKSVFYNPQGIKDQNADYNISDISQLLKIIA